MVLYRDPFAEMTLLRDAINNLFENAFVRPLSLIGRAGLPLASEIYETPEEFRIRLAVPGVAPDKVSIQAHQDSLVIRGAYPDWTPAEGAEQVTWHLRELPRGQFSQTIQVGPLYDTGKAEAEYANGILTVRVPRSEATKPRVIAVKAEASQPQLTAGKAS